MFETVEARANEQGQVGWLVVWGLTSSEIVFQSISGRLPERGRQRRNLIDEK